jgi:hypothetical protein
VVDKLGIKLELTAAHKGEYGIWHEGSTINGGASLDKTQVFTLETIGASVTWEMIVKEEDLHRYRKYQEGSVGYFFHGVFDGVGEAVGGTLKFFASDAWKGETWKNFAKTAYAVSAPNSYEGIMFRAGIANKAANADIYDWGNFTGQVAVAAIGTKGMGGLKGAGTVAKVGTVSNGSAKLASNGVKLAKQLASESQLAEAGLTIVKPGALRDAARLTKQYGGQITDWVKKTSSSYTINGTTFEIHWYENISTGLRVEQKTKFP